MRRNIYYIVGIDFVLRLLYVCVFVCFSIYVFLCLGKLVFVILKNEVIECYIKCYLFNVLEIVILLVIVIVCGLMEIIFLVESV